MFSAPLHVGRPNLGDLTRFQRRIDDALDRLWLTMGPLGEEFEQRLAEAAGTKYCVTTCNATVGIQIAARACGINPGDEVIVPSFTWVATAHALSWIGVVPVFCDVDEDSACLDPAEVEALITPRTKGILGVHVFGTPCDIAALTEVADRHDLPLIFDAAHALGCTYHGKPIGGFGKAEVFSFHATKFVNSFEGGAIVTNDEQVAVAARAMRNFGIGENREVGSVGTNGKMNEGAAAMGLTSLEVMESLIETNCVNYECYEKELNGAAGIRLRPRPGTERANLQYLVIEVDETVSDVDRDTLHDVLLAENVLSRKYFSPSCHELEPYSGALDVHLPRPAPRSEALARRVLALPTGTAIGPEEISGICEIIRRTVEPA
jgi:dTDP-4-amino-4,6-dideoxygalactose transaminase